MRIWIKVCGITNREDALAAVSLGVDALGVNLVPTSQRAVDLETAKDIAQSVNGQVLVVAVVADLTVVEMREVKRATAVHALQLHGDEPEWVLEALLPDAYKAIRIGCAQDLELAGRYGGERILVDAKVPGQLGGTGATFDWSLVSPLSAVRPLVLAGGLTHENVRAAISQVRPAGVDVATGVERPGEPRRKDLEKLARFVEAARQAASDCPKTQAC